MLFHRDPRAFQLNHVVRNHQHCPDSGRTELSLALLQLMLSIPYGSTQLTLAPFRVGSMGWHKTYRTAGGSIQSTADRRDAEKVSNSRFQSTL